MLPIVLALAFIAILFGIVVAGRPDDFEVSRSIRISSAPDRVFPLVNDLHRWEAWSPWAKLDPNAKSSFTGSETGVGAAMSWDGNKKVGAGKMTITESAVGKLIQLKLEFLRPFQATNTARFEFKSEGAQCLVTWSMARKNQFFFKLFGLFVNCDNMIGKDFERGLSSLKSVAETQR